MRRPKVFLSKWEALIPIEAREIVMVFSAKIIAAGLGFIALVIVTRSLNLFDLGLFSLAMAVMVVAMEFSGQGILLSMVRFYPSYVRRKKNPDLVFKAALKLGIMMAITVLIVGLILSKPLALVVFKRPEAILPLRLVFVGAFGATMWSYILATLMAHQSFKKFAFLDLLNSVLKVTLVGFLFLLFTGTLFQVLTVYVVIPFLCFSIGLAVIPKNFLRIQDSKKETQWELFHFGKWIIVSSLIYIAYSRIDVLLLGYFKPPPTVASYAAALNLATSIDILILSLMTVLLPKVSQMSTRKEYLGYIRKSLKLTIPISVTLLPLIFLAKPLILILYSPKFAGSIPIFVLLFLGSLIIFTAFPLVLILFSLNLPHYVAFSNFGVFTFSFLGNYLVIPKYGALGVAWVTMFSKIVIVLIVLSLIYLRVLRPGSVQRKILLEV